MLVSYGMSRPCTEFFAQMNSVILDKSSAMLVEVLFAACRHALQSFHDSQK